MLSIQRRWAGYFSQKYANDLKMLLFEGYNNDIGYVKLFQFYDPNYLPYSWPITSLRQSDTYMRQFVGAKPLIIWSNVGIMLNRPLRTIVF